MALQEPNSQRLLRLLQLTAALVLLGLAQRVRPFILKLHQPHHDGLCVRSGPMSRVGECVEGGGICDLAREPIQRRPCGLQLLPSTAH